jgi:putative acetyltransferase
MVFTVRPEQPDDYDSIREVHERAFAPRVQEAAIVEDLRAEGSCVADLTLVALRGDDVVGHVCISRAHVDSALPILVLGPMGVLPEFQRRGAGSALMREALGRAAKTDFPLVSVVGHSTYYPRFGFERASGYGIIAPFEVPSGAWMVYRLPAHRPEARGKVVYPDGFGEL